MKNNRKLWMSLLIGWPYLLSSHQLASTAIEMGRDLTATGVMIGAISAGVVGILGVFIYGNVQEHRTNAASNSI